MLSRVYLSLGSNLGIREQNLRTAVARLTTVGTVGALSSLYETEPVEFTAQPWFLNCVVALETEKPPRALLDSLLTLEQAMGRQRTQLKGPRTIDLDILLYGDQIVQEAGLVIPHPALPERPIWFIRYSGRPCSNCGMNYPPGKRRESLEKQRSLNRTNKKR
jgi:2-amino-4-hydroxy-6-hydroxymethyldihydropteridine diphosphokinase